MKNALIWIVVFCLFIFISHKTPKSAQEWLIIEAGGFLFWICAGLLLLLRATLRFLRQP